MVKGTKGSSTVVKGTKRQISIEKISNKNSLATCFTKRRDGLYSKASQICLLSGSQMAVLAAPLSSQSNVSFFSFGHSSVDDVMSAFLTGQRPVTVPEDNKQSREDIGICLSRKDLGLGFWWEDDKFDRSEDVKQVKDAVQSMSILLNELRSMKNQAFDKDLEKKKTGKKDVVLHQETTQTVNREFDDDVCEKNNTQEPACVTDHNDKPSGILEEWDEMEIDQLLDMSSDDETGLKSTQPNCNDSLTTETKIIDSLNGFINNNTQITLVSEIFDNAGSFDEWDEKDIDELLDLFSVPSNLDDETPANLNGFINNTQENGSLDDQEMDLDQFEDFELNFEGLLPDELFSVRDDHCLSHVFNGLPNIATL